jgi:putative CocE/NonD family hydrolase
VTARRPDPPRDTTIRRPSAPLGGIRRLIDAGVTMRDGVRLSADVYLPPRDEPVPAILVRTPYNNSDAYYTDQARFFVGHGYAFVVQDCRGRFDSEGEFRPWFPEAADGFDTQEWVGTQPWCNGTVGTIGSSYDGATQWLAAPLANRHLKAMVPAVVPSDYWAQDHYVGGAFTHGLNVSWAVRNAARSRRELTALETQQLWWHLPLATADAAAGTDIPWYREWLDHPAYDDFWRAIATREHWRTVDVPALNVCGWYDAYAGAAIEHWMGVTANGATAATRRAQRLVMGPWHHLLGERVVGQVDFGTDAVASIRDLELRFLDRWLRGIAADELDAELPLRLFVMGENRWRDEAEWPLARTRWSDWFLGPDGTLAPDRPTASDGADAADSFTYDPANPVMTTGGNHSLVHPAISVGPFDQRSVEARADVLVYTGPVLDEPLEVTGPVSAVLAVSSSAPDTDFTARLCDVFPDGRSINLCEGVLRARYRNSNERPNLMAAGSIYELMIDLGPTSNVFLPGHRVRLDISSSNFPRIDRNLNTGGAIGFESEWRIARNTVHRSAGHASRLILPVIPR